MKTKELIDLGALTYIGNQVFSGSPEGEKVRAKAGLDEIDESDVEVEIKIPADAMAFTRSFFLGMFAPSVRKLGAAGFRKKYKFTGPDFSNIIAKGIADAEVVGPIHAT